MDQQLALIELYEYKVGDLLAGRVPQGGRRSVLELREALLRTDLDGIQIRHFSRIDREFRSFRRGEHSPATGEPEPVTAVEVSPITSNAGRQETPLAASERSAWEELQQLVWFGDLHSHLLTLSQNARTEAGHATLRVIYAVTETAERLLRGDLTPFPVPVSDDPLLSLGDREISLELAETLGKLLLDPQGEEAVMTALARIQAQPFPRHSDEDVLAARIESAEREPISKAAREELIRALRLQYPQAADPRERPAVRRASDQLQQVLNAYADARPRPLGVPDGSILYSDHRRVSLAVPPEEQDQLVIFLAGEGQDTYWHGLHLRWQHSGQDWQLMLDKQLVLLRPSLEASQRQLSVQVGQDRVHLYHAGDYVLVQHTLVPREALQELAQQAQVTAQLLDPLNDFANLRLGRATSRFLREGQVNPDDFTAAAAMKYHAVDATELLDFARQGAVTLMTRAAQIPPEELRRSFEVCADQLHLSRTHARALFESLQDIRLQVSQTSGSTTQTLNVRSDGGFEAMRVGDGPLNLQFGGRTLTLNRDYKRDLVALLPGGTAGEKAVLHDLLVVTLGDMSVVLTRWNDWVAVSAHPVIQN